MFGSMSDILSRFQYPGVVFREADEADIPKVVEFSNSMNPRPFHTTVESARFHWQNLHPKSISGRYIGEADGDWVALMRVRATPEGEPHDRGYISISVRPDWRRRGLASALYPVLEKTSLEWGAKVVNAWTHSLSGGGEHFLEKMGMFAAVHCRFSQVPLAEANLAPFEEKVARLMREGYEFFRFSDRDTPDTRRKAHDLFIYTDREMPSDGEVMPDLPYEVWEKLVFGGNPDCNARSFFFASWQGELVAVTGMEFSSPGVCCTLTTGVRQQHRGKGLAGAVKCFSLRQCLEDGLEIAITENSHKNGPMLCVNEALGYKPFCESYWMEKRIA